MGKRPDITSCKDFGGARMPARTNTTTLFGKGITFGVGTVWKRGRTELRGGFKGLVGAVHEDELMIERREVENEFINTTCILL